MTLEERIASWVNLGSMPYQEVYALQQRLSVLRKADQIPDIILAVQHPAEINFGNSTVHNQFSPEFAQTLTEQAGKEYTHDDVKRILHTQGINFSQSSRGGGATLLAPGQLVYYPIVNFEAITGKQMDVSGYKAKIYRIMFESLQSLGVPGINVSTQTPDSQLVDRNERRDIWLQQEGKSYKLGSKGLHFSGNIAYHGFSLYIDHAGIDHFWMVKPCGYDHAEVGVTSVEKVLGRKIPHRYVNECVQRSMQKHFNYSMIVERDKSLLEVAA